MFRDSWLGPNKSPNFDQPITLGSACCVGFVIAIAIGLEAVSHWQSSKQDCRRGLSSAAKILDEVATPN